MAVPPGLPPIDPQVIAAAKDEAKAKIAAAPRANTITVSVTINAKVYTVRCDNLGGLDDYAKGAYIDGTLQKILDIARTEKLGEPSTDPAKQNKTVSKLTLTSNNTIEKEVTKAGITVTKVYQLTAPIAASTTTRKYIKLEGTDVSPKRQKIFDLLSNINTVYDSMINRNPNTSVELGQPVPPGVGPQVQPQRQQVVPAGDGNGIPSAQNKATAKKLPVVEDLDENEDVESEEEDDNEVDDVDENALLAKLSDDDEEDPDNKVEKKKPTFGERVKGWLPFGKKEKTEKP